MNPTVDPGRRRTAILRAFAALVRAGALFVAPGLLGPRLLALRALAPGVLLLGALLPLSLIHI